MIEHRNEDSLLVSVTGEAEAGSAEEQPVEESPVEDSLRWDREPIGTGIAASAKGGRDEATMESRLKEMGKTRNDKEFEPGVVAVGDSQCKRATHNYGSGQLFALKSQISNSGNFCLSQRCHTLSPRVEVLPDA